MARSWGGRRVQLLRARMLAAVRAGGAICTRCGQPIPPDTPAELIDLDHLLALAEGGTVWDPANHGPAHATCNRAAGARLTNHRRTATYTRTRRWT